MVWGINSVLVVELVVRWGEMVVVEVRGGIEVLWLEVEAHLAVASRGRGIRGRVEELGEVPTVKVRRR